MKPDLSEAYIIGKWILENGKVVADANCKRIDYLIHHYFTKVKTSPDGWFAVYQDPDTTFYWELSYPQSELQGGGPPKLYRINAEIANKAEYNPNKKLTREELVVIVQKLLDIEGTYDDEQAQWRALQANFLDWKSVLNDVYRSNFEDGYKMSAEEIVDKGLTWMPIELPERLPGLNE